MDLNDLLPAKQGCCLVTSRFRDMPSKYIRQKVGVFVFALFSRATKKIINKDLFTVLCVEVVFVQKRFVVGETGIKRYHKIIAGFTLDKNPSCLVHLLQNSV